MLTVDPPGLRTRVAAHTRARLRALPRSGATGRLAHEAASSLAEGHPEAAFAGPIRAALSSAEVVVELRAALARARTPGGVGDVALFAVLARTPHLLEVVPAHTPDAHFHARTEVLLARLEEASRSELALVLAPLVARSETLAIELSTSTELACPSGVRPLGIAPFLLHLRSHTAQLRAHGDALLVETDGARLTVDRHAPQRTEAAGAALRPRPRLAGSSVRLTTRLVARRGGLRLGSTVDGLDQHLGSALALLRRAWPEASAAVERYTEVIVPLEEPGTVSYSLAARPGHVYINVFGKSYLQLVDDLLHETAHHVLHAYEETEELLCDADDDSRLWWSPWRRTWRPLRGLLHATFTFSYAAALFAALLASDDQEMSAGRRRFAARRLLEEAQALALAHLDLGCAARGGALSEAGAELVGSLRRFARGPLARAAEDAQRELVALGSPGQRELGRLQRDAHWQREQRAAGPATSC